MKRLTALAAYLVLGATSAWALAWILTALSPGPTSAISTPNTSLTELWRASAPPGCPASPNPDLQTESNTAGVRRHTLRRFNVGEALDRTLELLDSAHTAVEQGTISDAQLRDRVNSIITQPTPTPHMYSLDVVHSGFPMLCLTGQRWHVLSDAGSGPATDVHQASFTLKHDALWLFPTADALLPLSPEWTGFFVNTVCYSILIWLSVRLVGRLRATLRLKRGRCPKCGYPLSSSTCPECGTAHPSATEAAA